MSFEVKRYHPALITLHWLLAIAILGMYVFGSFVLDDMDNTDLSLPGLLSLHLIIGVAILVLTVVRLTIRVRMPRPDLVPGSRGAQKVATALQHSMYTLTVLIVLSGLALAYFAHLFGVLYGHTGTLPKDFDDFTSHDIHGWLADGLMVVVGLHVAAALQHQFLLKDGIMSRMSLFVKN